MIRADGLTKRYGSQLAVDDVSFSVRPGTVTGYLGPNGAGKSTSMRMLVGLTAPSAGSSRILGVPYQQLENPGRHVGVLLDASAQHAGRTGREVLALAALLTGAPARRIDELLSLVGLDGDPAKKRIGHYSLGMRQRLGIAHALIGEPTVLVLDEPANGLDPAGIRWMRDLLRDFANNGGTVLLSSHLLHEVEMVADELVIIAEGRILAQGTIGALLGPTGVSVRASDEPALIEAFTLAGITFTRGASGWLQTDSGATQVLQAAAASAVVLTELKEPESGGLEDLYLKLTSDSSRTTATFEDSSGEMR